MRLKPLSATAGWPVLTSRNRQSRVSKRVNYGWGLARLASRDLLPFWQSRRLRLGVRCLASRNRLAIMSKPTPKGDWSERRLCQIVNFPRRSLPELSNATTRVTPQKDHERKAGDDDVVDVAGIEPDEYVRS